MTGEMRLIFVLEEQNLCFGGGEIKFPLSTPCLDMLYELTDESILREIGLVGLVLRPP